MLAYAVATLWRRDCPVWSRSRSRGYLLFSLGLLGVHLVWQVALVLVVFGRELDSDTVLGGVFLHGGIATVMCTVWLFSRPMRYPKLVIAVVVIMLGAIFSCPYFLLLSPYVVLANLIFLALSNVPQFRG